MTKKTSSILSVLFFILAVLPLIFGLTKGGNGIYLAVINVSIFIPLYFSVLGLVYGLKE